MDISKFRSSIAAGVLPTGLEESLIALWYDARGDWETAHSHAQDDKSPAGSWVHGFLHRKEGDLGNAAYWYRRAGKPEASGSLDEEWTQIVMELLPSK